MPDLSRLAQSLRQDAPDAPTIGELNQRVGRRHRRRNAIVGTAAALLLVVGALGAFEFRGSGSTETTVPAGPQKPAVVLSFSGIDAIKLGMTLREAEAVGGPIEIIGLGDPGQTDTCYYASPKNVKDSVRFTVLSANGQKVTGAQTGIILAISSSSGLPVPIGTDRVAVGATEDELRRAYADHKLTESSHDFPTIGHYIDVAAGPNDPAGSQLRFSTTMGQVDRIWAVRSQDALSKPYLLEPGSCENPLAGKR
jgi:hypothetical protein